MKMQIITSKFCSLATSPSFQAWLYNYDAELYRRFITKLRDAQGCGENRELMKALLAEIERLGGADIILDFLQKNYPNMIEGGVKAPAATDNYDNIFTHYNPSILTYPRRIIFTGPKQELKKKVHEFLLNKLKSDYIIVDSRAYVEYLEQSDIAVEKKIPLTSWLISQYRLRL